MKKGKNKYISSDDEWIKFIGDYLESLSPDYKEEVPLDNHLIQESKYGEQYDNRDELYTELLKHYIDTTKLKNNNNKKYKKVFFWVVVCAFVALVATPITATFIVLYNGLTDTAAIIALVGGAVSAIPAVIVLPQIIAQHLFPTDEDKNMIDLVKSMQENDSGIRSNSKQED